MRLPIPAKDLTIAAPGLGPYVVPMAVAILVALFAIQSQGTARIGHAFGPVMAGWFTTIALLGVWSIAKHPAVLVGLDPRYAMSYMARDGLKGFAVLGGVAHLGFAAAGFFPCRNA